jgi:hypothetical protein
MRVFSKEIAQSQASNAYHMQIFWSDHGLFQGFSLELMLLFRG